jgi:quinol-cytochrome oxidoreductase complex cytochrome b subunit
VFLIVYAWFVFYIPNYLGDADNYIPANPLVTPAHIVPEWYLLPFYAILRAIPNKLVGVVCLFSAIAVLAFLPWLDSSPVKSGKYRPVFRVFFWAFVAVCLGLGWLGGAAAGVLLFRVLPDRPAAARAVREDQAVTGFDRRRGAGQRRVGGAARRMI